MIFSRKKKMIDIRELQRRGVVKIPEKDIIIPTDSQGFIELSASRKKIKQEQKPTKNMFGFFDTPQSSSNSFSTQSEGYNKREVDEKITSLDNKIYKLEQRIELLERKLDVNQSSNNSGIIRW